MRDAPDAPVADSELARLLAPLSGHGKLALAVSGGADSFALLHLVQRWRALQACPPDIVVLIVDHGLRPEAAAEAETVARRCALHDLPHRILRWRGEKPASGIQQAAREARYRLMAAAMREEGAQALVLAHHRDDQAETFLDRLARGSGPYGLAAMAPAAELHGTLLLRPLLELPKSRLVATLRAAGLDWCEDGSNDDGRYRRVALRRLMPSLADVGLGAERLAATARTMARAASALDAWVDREIAGHVERHQAGPCRMEMARLAGLPEEIRLRLLARLVRDCAGAPYVPRLEALEAALAAVLADDREGSGRGAGAKRTLGGCVLQRRGSRLLVFRELGRTPPRPLALSPGESHVWDRRFEVALDGAAPRPVRISHLGAGGLRRAGLEPQGGWPRSAFDAAPAIHADEHLVAVPGFAVASGEGWSGLIVARPIAAMRDGAAA